MVLQLLTILAIINTSVTTILFFILLVLFILSFLFSGSQMAYFSLTLKDINMLKTRQQPSYKRIVTLLENPKSLMASLLIANTFVNIGIILISNLLLDQWITTLDLHFVISFLLKIIIISLVLILFCEVLPKVWAAHHKIWFASTASMVVDVFNSMLSGISLQLVGLDSSIERAFKSGNEIKDDSQLDDAIDLLPDNKASSEEKQILKGIRKFSNTTVKQTMRPRLDVTGIDASVPFTTVLEKVKDYSYSRLPVYKSNLDEIVGILHTKDLLSHLNDKEIDWHPLMRPVFYVHEQKLIEDLLQDFRNKRIHMAVVVDEFGGTSGIITLEDIMEEIIGDIQDEFDDEQSGNKKIDDYNYIFEGKTMINDLCRVLKIPTHTFDLLRGESDSLAGLILEIAGEFPTINQQFETNNYIFTVLEINKNRIAKVKLTLKQKQGK
ncbi:gliding motility-associated protein GldE [Hanamia caeni]|uniref:Gliding motility-associated protein GldE n=1 Tax=Hanamia caeni TaxID=2294116 RepID=A0A3M9NMJ0_9BACT|nr:gliding motility-associated protein GldE [Hanamia caeni]